jgi:ergothioneine biosynthesis protein EgtB
MSAALTVVPASLLPRYLEVRTQSLALCRPLTPEDMMVQSCTEASPAKWHLAHTTWFFETFLLTPFSPGYTSFHPDFLWLFNSYYNSISDQPQKKLRASFSRPSIEEILAYREHVDAAMTRLIEAGLDEEAERRLVLGLHHEQQHQELLVTDIKHAFWSNPLHPAYREGVLPGTGDRATGALTNQLVRRAWQSFDGGIQSIGHEGEEFAFDNELPRHKVYVEPFALATRLVTSAEYLQFMDDGGYSRAELWLSEGWQAVHDNQWRAPLYWHRRVDSDDSRGVDWELFTLRGNIPLNALLAAPITHISYFEADAYARWAGQRLPTEAEWEIAAASSGTQTGIGFLECGDLHPIASAPNSEPGLLQMAGSVWQWTASAYLGYPGYAAVPGALGEYNGKFMSNQMVLRGGSVATPVTHIRATYRNFFPSSTRWQFSGLRLARR